MYEWKKKDNFQTKFRFFFNLNISTFNTQICIIIVVFILRKKLSGLAALFEEASKCMLTMPSLIFPSIIACILLALFLAFWVAVVVCLATANYPTYVQQLLQQTPSNITELAAIAEPKLRERNNTEADYKNFRLIEYEDFNILKSMLWVYLIGLIWTAEFIFGKVLVKQFYL